MGEEISGGRVVVFMKLEGVCCAVETGVVEGGLVFGVGEGLCDVLTCVVVVEDMLKVEGVVIVEAVETQEIAPILTL